MSTTNAEAELAEVKRRSAALILAGKHRLRAVPIPSEMRLHILAATAYVMGMESIEFESNAQSYAFNGTLDAFKRIVEVANNEQ